MSPNLQDSRVTPLQTRALLSLVGVTGIECPPSQLSDAEAAAVKASFVFTKLIAQNCKMAVFIGCIPVIRIRIRVCWLITNEAKTKALVLTSAGVVSPIPHYQHVLLHYLNPEVSYQINDKATATGAELNYAGITLPLAHGDFSATLMSVARGESPATKPRHCLVATSVNCDFSEVSKSFLSSLSYIESLVST